VAPEGTREGASGGGVDGSRVPCAPYHDVKMLPLARRPLERGGAATRWMVSGAEFGPDLAQDAPEPRGFSVFECHFSVPRAAFSIWRLI